LRHNDQQQATPMSIALNLYEQLNRAGDEPERFQAIADAFDAMEQRYIARENVATKSDLRETELRLQKEIELLRATTETELARIRGETQSVELNLRREIEMVKGELSKEIETVKGELSKEIETLKGELSKEIETLKGELSKEIEQVRLETRTVEARLLGAVHRQTIWIISAVGAVVGLVRVLDYLFK
jgi:excinuclease UvrABC helicase subunit UvrB